MIRRLLTFAIAMTAAAAVGCGSGSSSSGASAPTPSPTPQTVSVTESEFTITPSTLSLKPGSYVFQLQNTGKFPHDLHIATSDGSEIAKSDMMSAGGSTSFPVTLKAGNYTIWCAVDSHRQRGMQGTISVQ